MAGTAVYGTVCTVVREDGGREPSSYPMCAIVFQQPADVIYIDEITSNN
jgi:hypothetical protein